MDNIIIVISTVRVLVFAEEYVGGNVSSSLKVYQKRLSHLRRRVLRRYRFQIYSLDFSV